MQDFDKINPLNQKDRELLSDLKSTFDLGTQTIIGQDEDEIIDDLIDLNPYLRLIFITIIISLFFFFNKDFILFDVYFETFDSSIRTVKFNFIFTVFCIVAIINAFNLFDGLNGLSLSYFVSIFLYLVFKYDLISSESGLSPVLSPWTISPDLLVTAMRWLSSYMILFISIVPFRLEKNLTLHH